MIKLQRDILIPALDLMLVLLVIFIIGILSVRFIAEKGLGSESYFPLNFVLPDDLEFQKNPNFPFVAIIINQNEIILMKIGDGKIKEVKSFTTINELANNIKSDDVYVIYEEDQNNYLGDVIRSLSKTNSKVFITLKRS
jgi:hypothetical protein